MNALVCSFVSVYLRVPLTATSMRVSSQRKPQVDKQELKSWLAPSTASSFAIAVLEDLFSDDADVRAWLDQSRNEFGGLTASELLHAGRADEVEALLVRLWNTSTQPRMRRPTHGRRSLTA